MSNLSVPLVLFLGPDKSGSTWCYDYAAKHSDVVVAKAKDLFFFDDDRTFARGIDWYLAQFGTTDGTTLFDVGHDYLFSENAAKRVGRLKASAKGIETVVCVRNPLDRAFSSYRYMLRQGRLTCSFSDALQTVPELVEHGQYGSWCEMWLKETGELPSILSFSLLSSDEEAFANDLCSVLGVRHSDSGVQLRDVQKNGAVQARNPRTIAFLRRLLGELRRLGLHQLAGKAKEFALDSELLFKPATAELPTSEDQELFWEMYGSDAGLLDSLYGTDFSSDWGCGRTIR